MIIPDESDPGWAKAISRQESPDYELLATKLLLGRLAIIYEMNPTQETIQKCVAELREYFFRNKDLPKAQADLLKMFGEVDL
ncbi:MAG: hypothetical protein GYA17_13545 [Chloroflexi bacterium]|jgi:hypothetical protein|nr:hypothetical protein [Anaerolineaceae bacterium]NMB89377.1 hypothetical protein [Chloroflexota bacterium]